MGLDERSRAADSLASVLAVYDGFCNLKQVRPSGPPSQILPFYYKFHSLCFFASRFSGFRSMLLGVQSSDLFSWISLSKMLSVREIFGPVQQPVKFLVRFRVSTSLPYHSCCRHFLSGWSCLSLFFSFFRRLQVSDTLFFFTTTDLVLIFPTTIELQIYLFHFILATKFAFKLFIFFIKGCLRILINLFFN